MSDEQTIAVGKPEWAIIERSLSACYGGVSLICDGYRLTLCATLVKRKLVTVCYVNGQINGRWLFEDCEERRRFMRPQQHRMPAKLIKLYRKLNGKTWKPPVRYSYDFAWPSPLPLLRHLCKHNTDIRMVLP